VGDGGSELTVAASTIKRGEGAASVVTPSGLSIRFESKPRRHYVIQPGETKGDVWTPNGDAVEAISVTTALDKLYKGGLDWWGMRVGIGAVCRLVEMGEVRFAIDEQRGGAFRLAAAIEGTWEWGDDTYTGELADPSKPITNVEALMRAHSMRVDKVKEEAGDRGTTVHDALEMWATIGQLPDPNTFPLEQAGYVRGLIAFLEDSKITPRQSEVLVGSYEYGYAGRFDLECESPLDSKIVTKVYPKAGPKHRALPIGIGRLDLKTSSDIYYNNLLQLVGYEHGCVECGYGPSDWQGVLRVLRDGRYELRILPQDHRKLDIEDFVRVVRAADTIRRAEEAMKV
jgi:hypothetical protein